VNPFDRNCLPRKILLQIDDEEHDSVADVQNKTNITEMGRIAEREFHVDADVVRIETRVMAFQSIRTMSHTPLD
jgi:hypothetical protein